MVHLPLITQSLDYYVVMMAWLVILARKDPGTSSPFSSVFDPQSNEHQSFVSHSAVSQKRTKHPVSNKCPPLR